VSPRLGAVNLRFLTPSILAPAGFDPMTREFPLLHLQEDAG
jgi:hypothetical protein